jgi:hypothetical protein
MDIRRLKEVGKTMKKAKKALEDAEVMWDYYSCECEHNIRGVDLNCNHPDVGDPFCALENCPLID